MVASYNSALGRQGQGISGGSHYGYSCQNRWALGLVRNLTSINKEEICQKKTPNVNLGSPYSHTCMHTDVNIIHSHTPYILNTHTHSPHTHTPHSLTTHTHTHHTLTHTHTHHTHLHIYTPYTHTHSPHTHSHIHQEEKKQHLSESCIILSNSPACSATATRAITLA